MLTLNLEVLRHQSSNVYAALCSLRVVTVLEVESGHAVQPSLPQLRGVAIRLGKTVVQVNQLLVITLVDLRDKYQR